MKGSEDSGICSKAAKRSCISGLVAGIVLTIVAMYMYTSYHPLVQDTTSLGTSLGTLAGHRFPDIIIIGVRKGGTKALITVLDLHPKIKAAKSEVHFFDDKYYKGIDWYLSQMPPVTDDQLVIEKTPRYFVTPGVPERIFNYSKTVKLLLIVRDPVIRLVSDYTQLDAKRMNKNRRRPTIEEVVFYKNGTVKLRNNAIRCSQYDIHLQRWLRVFPQEQIFVVDGNAFISDPFKEIIKVERFLNIEAFFKEEMFVFNKEKGFYCWKGQEPQSDSCLGDSKGREHPEVSSDTVNKLKTFLRPHTEKFCSLANVKFSWCTIV